MRDFLRITIPFFAVGALAFWWAGRRVSADVRRTRWIKFLTYVVIVHGVLAAAIAGTPAVVVLLAAIVGGGALEIMTASRRLRRDLAGIVPVAFLAIGAGAIAFGLSAPPMFVAYIYLVVAAFDGFSQAGGQLAGRRRLAPSISPGKTIEGFVIGVAGAMVSALLFLGAVSLSIDSALTLAVIASGAGLAGDLAASWVKRRAGIKDYGTLLPGHGGVLDRFDSFLAVAAVLFLLRARR